MPVMITKHVRVNNNRLDSLLQIIPHFSRKDFRHESPSAETTNMFLMQATFYIIAYIYYICLLKYTYLYR